MPTGCSLGGIRTASAYSPGGGKPFKLCKASPFSGSLAGGATRLQSFIYGNKRYGSGYPYGGWGTYIDNRPLPFVFYPIPIYPNYYGGDAYTPQNGTRRPGGTVSVAMIKGDSGINATEVYRIIGDHFSVSVALNALVTSCAVENTTIFDLDPLARSFPLPQQVIQWYRASTFGLSLDSYSNTATLPSNMPISNDTAPPPLDADSPLPSGLNISLLTCLNTTIGASIPLVDPLPLTTMWDSLPSIIEGLITIAMILWILGAAMYHFCKAIWGWVCSLVHRLKEWTRGEKRPPSGQYVTLEDGIGGQGSDLR
ncbi:hypothetical protein JAAARDRAFT_195341 [Jaapia argillacea MUCL 33604]|uniref:Uncharacterized protein n=1 Tax=Jaapia argillacea MUCL 33604 TaxID=933084 RepID=A0A067PXY5_9AGAM|nr:hypothetical protein JAAARDRAFT_195341 [Jaapia argillacea MUCL 33604]